MITVVVGMMVEPATEELRCDFDMETVCRSMNKLSLPRIRTHVVLSLRTLVYFFPCTLSVGLVDLVISENQRKWSLSINKGGLESCIIVKQVWTILTDVHKDSLAVWHHSRHHNMIFLFCNRQHLQNLGGMLVI